MTPASGGWRRGCPCGRPTKRFSCPPIHVSTALPRRRTATPEPQGHPVDHFSLEFLHSQGQTRPFALVEPRASFPSRADPRHDNQVVALGPMLSVSDLLSAFWKKNRRWC